MSGNRFGWIPPECREAAVARRAGGAVWLGPRQSPAGPSADELVFPKLFPRPTGRNAWELAVRAGDLLGKPPLSGFEEITGERLDRDSARRAMALPGMAGVVSLVLESGRLPFESPRKSFDFSTLFPDLALWRRVARFVSLAVFDQAVSGRSRDAALLAESGVRMARAVASEALIGTLVSIACETVIWRRLVDIAPMLSDTDLDRLGNVLLTGASDRSRFNAGLQIEVQGALAMIHRSLPARDLERLEDDADPGVRGVAAVLRDPTRVERIREAFGDLLRKRLESDLRDLANPTGWRPQSSQATGLPGDLAVVEALLPKPSLGIARMLSASMELRLAGLYLRCWAYRRRRLRWPSKLSDVAGAPDTVELVGGRAIGYERLVDADAVRLRATPLPTQDGEAPREFAVPVPR